MTLPGGTDRLLETLRGEGGLALRWHLHADRMERSARCLNVPFSRERFAAEAHRAAAEARLSPCRIRVTLDGEGAWVAESSPLPALPDTLVLTVSAERVASTSPLSPHKLLPRGIYDRARAEAEAKGAWDGILVNERGELCETGRANLVLLRGDDFLTPALMCGVLPGTVRGGLLNRGFLREASLSEADLDRASALFVTNALIGVQEVTAVKGTDYSPDGTCAREALASMRSALARL